MSQRTIALSGLSEPDAALFETSLAAMPDHGWTLDEAASAAYLVVDIDTVWGHMDWLRATANGQQVIAFTRDAQVRDCDLVLNKPLDEQQLAALLSKAAAAPVPAAPTPAPAPEAPSSPPAAPDLAPAPPEPVAPQTTTATPAPPVDHHSELELEPTPEPAPEPPADRTLGESLLGGHLTRPIHFQHGAVSLILDPEHGAYAGSSSLKPLVPLLDMTISQGHQPASDELGKLHQAATQPITRLMWLAALYAHAGQLSDELDPQAGYRLARWPEIEREFPRHFRIATTMMKAPGTLGDIASAANASVADVADFINAYSIAGYVTTGIDNSTATQGESGGGMFSRLRRRRRQPENGSASA